MASHVRYRGNDSARELKALAAMVVTLGVILAGAWWLTQRRPPPAPPAEARHSPTAQEPALDDPVVIEVNGEPIYLSELQTAIASLPPQAQERYANEIGRKEVAEELVRMKLLEQEARRLGLDQDPKFRGRLDMMEANALASAALQRMLRSAGPPRLEDLYEKNKVRFETARVKSILIPYQGSRAQPRSSPPLTAEAAQARGQQLVARLRKGGSFDAIARAESADGRADLGEVTRGSLPPDLEEVIFGLPLGQISDPIRSPIGIHIFQVMERKTPTLEQMRPVLQQEAEGLQARTIMEDLRKQAKVEFKKPHFKG
jgi:peptidyl-prolyl cis-trans isomerase C